MYQDCSASAFCSSSGWGSILPRGNHTSEWVRDCRKRLSQTPVRFTSQAKKKSVILPLYMIEIMNKQPENHQDEVLWIFLWCHLCLFLPALFCYASTVVDYVNKKQHKWYIRNNWKSMQETENVTHRGSQQETPHSFTFMQISLAGQTSPHWLDTHTISFAR